MTPPFAADAADRPSGEPFLPSNAPSEDDRNLALIAHLSGCVGIVTAGVIGFVGPLVVYLISRNRSPYVEKQAKEALNFQITLWILGGVCFVIAMLSCFVLWPILFLPCTLQVVFGVIAALAVRDGRPYRYPMNVRLLQ